MNLLEQKSRFGAAFLVGLAIVLILVGAVYLLVQRSERSVAPQYRTLPMGAPEQAYVANIHFEGLEMSRAANFLNQQVTFLFGTVANDGPRSIEEMELRLEFHDVYDRVVLRDIRRLYGPDAAPLLAGQKREFQFSFEHIPNDWNVQIPSIRVTGLVLR